MEENTMAEKRERIVLKITDIETGAEQIAGEFIVVPGLGFCCSCSTSSLTSVIQQAEATARGSSKQ
jgi:hypothetical protein